MYGLETQRQDGITINLAGRQRMLIQQTARLSFELGGARSTVHQTILQAQNLFEQTLLALRDGGTAVYMQDDHRVVLRGTKNPKIHDRLDELWQNWQQYRQLLSVLQETSSASANFNALQQEIQTHATQLVLQADEIVRLYEAESEHKILWLRVVQVSFLVCALPLWFITVYFMQRGMLLPLKKLELAANRIAQNNFDETIPLDGTLELRALGETFEQMRVHLQQSRQALLTLNQSLEQRVLERTQQLETLHQISQEITARLDIQYTLNSITEKARSLLNGEVASLCLVDEKQRWLKLQASSGPTEAIQSAVVAIHDAFPQQVLGSEVALTCGLAACRAGCGMIKDTYRQHHFAVALRVQNRVIGALCVGSRDPQHFAQQSAEALTKLAGIAAIALENARLYAQTERVATLEERRRLAADMHDGLGQTLSYLGMMTDQTVEFLSQGQEQVVLERLQHMRHVIAATTADVRQAIKNLFDDTVHPPNFWETLHENLQNFAEANQLNLIWQVDLPATFTADAKHQINNIVHEALVNIVRHAQAHTVTLRAWQTADLYHLTIEDDGVGFDTAHPAAEGHFGLQIMQARAAHLGATFSIDSHAGQGTRIELIWQAPRKPDHVH